MSTILKQKYWAIGLVCLLIAGVAIYTYISLQARIDAREELRALWEEIVQSPDPGKLFRALDVTTRWELIRALPDRAAHERLSEFWKPCPDFWDEFWEARGRRGVYP